MVTAHSIRVFACSMLVVVAPLLFYLFGVFISRFDSDSVVSPEIGFGTIGLFSGIAFVALLPLRPAVKVFLAILSVPVNLALLMILGFYISCSVFRSCP